MFVYEVQDGFLPCFKVLEELLLPLQLLPVDDVVIELDKSYKFPVLLENKGILPLEQGAKIALFGRGARYTIKGGTGSGDVNSRNTITVDQGLRGAGFRIVNSDYLDRYDALFAEVIRGAVSVRP